jgi:hypothetical protein
MAETPRQNFADTDPDRAFLMLVIGYLDGQLDDAQTAALVDELRRTKARRDEFVDLCLQTAFMVELVKNQQLEDAWPPGVNDPEQQCQAGNLAEGGDAHRSYPWLQDMMILPAIRESDVPIDGEGAIELPALPASGGKPSRWAGGNVYRRARLVLAASILLAVALVARTVYNRSAAEHPAPATFVDSVEAKWNRRVPAVGQPVMANVPLELTQGLCRLKFDGAELIVEGPARFMPISGNRMQLWHGKLWVRAASTSGFEVVTPLEIIKDLGTEFGVVVAPSRETSVHVFVGSVAISSTDKQASKLVLITGEAVAFDASGLAQPKTTANPVAFVRPEQFAAAVAAGEAPVRDHRLLTDPSLVAHFTFAEVAGKPTVNPTGGAIDNVSRRLLFGDGTDARTVPTLVPGRRSGKPALHFDGHQQGRIPATQAGALDFSRDEQADPFTVAVWVRAAPMKSNIKNAGIIARGDYREKQYVLDIVPGSFRFYLRDADGKDYEVIGGVARDNDWHMVVATYEPTSGAMNLYVDGMPQGTTQGPHSLFPSKGQFRIGSKPGEDAKYGFDGAIDEVTFWRRALSEEEIAALYRASAGE